VRIKSPHPNGSTCAGVARQRRHVLFGSSSMTSAIRLGTSSSDALALSAPAEGGCSIFMADLWSLSTPPNRSARRTQNEQCQAVCRRVVAAVDPNTQLLINSGGVGHVVLS
jgi:hypothetical protein